MIYKLDTDFSKIEQSNGLMQNLSRNFYVEVVSCTENPQKDSGIILLPLEKLSFNVKKGESVYVRSAHIGGEHVNISVVNFNLPASDNSYAGKIVPKMKIFDIAGTYEWIAPIDGYYKVSVTGGGGAGGNASLSPNLSSAVISSVHVAAGAGGGGGTAFKTVEIKKDNVVTVTVGAGGTKAEIDMSKDNNIFPRGGNGGTSSFGMYCSATGGIGGEACTRYTISRIAFSTPGGSGIGGDININGEKGKGQLMQMIADTVTSTNNFYSYSAVGGTSFWGKPKMTWSGNEERDGDKGVYGSGGGAAKVRGNTTPHYGGEGGDGIAIIEWMEME